MSVGHHESFPVASILLARGCGGLWASVFRFAWTAEDFADEGKVVREAGVRAD